MKNKVLGIITALITAISSFLFPVSAYVPYETKYDFGDVNGDKAITAGDALLALQFSVKKTALDYNQQNSADVNEDWEITAGDALLILQNSVEKITLERKEDVYENYKYNYVEPAGLAENTIYIITSDPALVWKSKNHDMVRLMTAIQGLINRNNDKHHVAVEIKMDSTDDAWLSYMMGSGKTYSGMEKAELNSADDVFDTFKEFMVNCGIIAWDPNVPSTANVAATICGLENYLPVVYDMTDGSLYRTLTEVYNVPVKMSLVGMFENVDVNGKIYNTGLKSTGSSKCDAYIWAIDKYLNRCNPELLAYTLDGASSIDTNPVKVNNPGNTGNAQVTGIPNHDYFILKQCFFFDLTSYNGEAPSDDPTQPIGTDSNTLKFLLQKRYELAGGKFGMILGFPPWHVKYTNFVGNYAMDPARLEWHFVETSTAYNCAVEADAAHPCWMSNGSLYTKYERTAEITGNTEADETVEYDPDTKYYALFYSGDFDCSPWLKARAQTVWNDKKRGTIDMTYSYNVNLVDRIPMVFDYIYEKKTENDYFTAGEGMGYMMPSMLFEGSTGKEANPITRTLTDGARAYLYYAKPYYDLFKINITARLLNGFSAMNTATYGLYNEISPGGVMLQNSAASADLGMYNNVAYCRLKFISLTDMDSAVINLRQQFGKSNFLSLGINDPGVNYGTASGIDSLVTAFNNYVSWKDPGVNYKYVSMTTFTKLLRESKAATELK